MAIAVIDRGRVVYVKPYGVCTPAGAPLQGRSILYGASLTKEAAFPALTRFVLGKTGFPWDWEHADMRFWQP